MPPFHYHVLDMMKRVPPVFDRQCPDIFHHRLVWKLLWGKQKVCKDIQWISFKMTSSCTKGDLHPQKQTLSKEHYDRPTQHTQQTHPDTPNLISWAVHPLPTSTVCTDFLTGSIYPIRVFTGFEEFFNEIMFLMVLFCSNGDMLGSVSLSFEDRKFVFQWVVRLK